MESAAASVFGGLGAKLMLRRVERSSFGLLGWLGIATIVMINECRLRRSFDDCIRIDDFR